MTTNEHISRLQEAQDLLREALDILKDVASEPSNNGHFAKHVIEDIETATNGGAWSLKHWIRAANHPELYASDMLGSGKPAPVAPTYIVDNGNEIRFVNPLCDQPSFPHDEAFAIRFRTWFKEGSVTEEGIVNHYAFTYQTRRKLARAAVRSILERDDE